MQLERYKLAELKNLAFYTGLQKTGTKQVLARTLRNEVSRPQAVGKRSTYRVLSVDMGIRNLAYCLFEVAEVDIAHEANAVLNSTGKPSLPNLTAVQGRALKIARVLSWHRLSVSSGDTATTTNVDASQPSVSASIVQDTSEDSKIREADGGPASKASVKAKKKAEAFDPVTMAKAAHDLVQNRFLEMQPTHILIEEQRHRSGGSFGVLEWTYRVNMLEAMIYAVLQTITARRKSTGADDQVTILPAGPKRMSSYWTSTNFISGLQREHPQEWKALGGLPEDKAGRVFLASWFLRRGLRFGEEQNAAVTREAFLRPSKRQADPEQDVNNRKSKASSKSKGKKATKLDDLADSLLHGLAFIDWEISRRVLQQSFASSSADPDQSGKSG